MKIKILLLCLLCPLLAFALPENNLQSTAFTRGLLRVSDAAAARLYIGAGTGSGEVNLLGDATATNTFTFGFAAEKSGVTLQVKTISIYGEGIGLTNSSTNLSLVLTNVVKPTINAVTSTSANTNYVLDFTNAVYRLTMTNNMSWTNSINDAGTGNYKETVIYLRVTNTVSPYKMWFNANWNGFGTGSTNGFDLTNGFYIIAFSKLGTSETNVCWSQVRAN